MAGHPHQIAVPARFRQDAVVDRERRAPVPNTATGSASNSKLNKLGIPSPEPLRGGFLAGETSCAFCTGA